MATPQLAIGSEDWISLAEPRAVSPSPFAGRDLKRQTPSPQSCPDPGRGPPGHVGVREVALPSLGFESCMASALQDATRVAARLEG